MARPIYTLEHIATIEAPQPLANNAVAGIHKEATVSGVNRFGFRIITSHYYATSAKFQRDWLKATGCTDIN